jgi:hypothetical protein
MNHQRASGDFKYYQIAEPAFDAMVRSDPAWLELYEIEDSKEPKRLRRYELPRVMGKRGRR